MKNKKFKELIQKPLRFHHQDIHQELEELKRMINYVSNQVQELRESITRTPITTQVLPVFQSYEHPWWKYYRDESISSGDNFRDEQQTPRSVNLDEEGS